MKIIAYLLICFPFLSLSQTSEIICDVNFELQNDQNVQFDLALKQGDLIKIDLLIEHRLKISSFQIRKNADAVLYSRSKLRGLDNDSLTITSDGVYSVIVASKTKLRKICKLQISRKPQFPEINKFETEVKWTTRLDTIWKTYEEKVVVFDTNATILYEGIPKISSKTALNGNPNTNIIEIDLPKNTIAWSYLITTDIKGAEKFQNAQTALTESTAKLFMKLPTYGPLISLAILGNNAIQSFQGADNVQYFILEDKSEVIKFRKHLDPAYLKKGDVVMEAARLVPQDKTHLYFCLRNDNIMDPIEVHIKALAITVSAREITETKRTFLIKEVKIPLNFISE